MRTSRRSRSNFRHARCRLMARNVRERFPRCFSSLAGRGSRLRCPRFGQREDPSLTERARLDRGASTLPTSVKKAQGRKTRKIVGMVRSSELQRALHDVCPRKPASIVRNGRGTRGLGNLHGSFPAAHDHHTGIAELQRSERMKRSGNLPRSTAEPSRNFFGTFQKAFRNPLLAIPKRPKALLA